MIRTASLFALLITASISPVMAQGQAPAPFPPLFDTRGTPEDQRACRGDAAKLCREFVDNDMAVLQCFQRQRTKLSKACKAVLEKYNQ